MVHKSNELVHVRTAGDTITATPNHPFWVQTRGWVDAGELKSGDKLVLADGGRADVVSLTREKLTSPVDVYNLEVADYHTYFVASSGVWVHNCGAGQVARGVEGFRITSSQFEAASPEAEYLGTEISMRLPNGTVMRADAVYRMRDELVAFESKYGMAARLTNNQAITFKSIAEGTYPVAFGGNAELAGIRGQSITSYVILHAR